MGALLLCLLLLTSLVGCAEEEQKNQPLGMVYFTYFDTVSYVYSYAGDPAELFEERSAGVSRILQEYHQLFDIYHEYSGINNLCTVNRLAGGDPVPVDAKLIDFKQKDKKVYELTNGEMNVMMGAVLRPWHDCRTAADSDPQNAKLPDMALLQNAAQHTDFSLLEIDAVNHTLRVTDPEASIDVGALGKGYATEGLRLTIQKAWEIIDEDEIYMSVNKNNPASLRVQIKNGAYIHHEDDKEFYTRIKK